jgi:hypothetical protein
LAKRLLLIIGGSTLNSICLSSEVSKILEFVEDHLVDINGELRHELTNSGLSEIYIYHDLGDITPFLIELKEIKILDNIFSKLLERLKNEKFLISKSPTLGKFYGFAKSYEYTDFLIGLEDLNRNRKCNKSTEILISSINQTVKIFKFKSLHSSYFYPKFRISIPIIDTRDTTFIEIFCDLSESLEDELYLDVAEKLFQRFKDIRNNDKLNLLPDYKANLLIRKLLSKKNNYTLMKNHTNTLHAYLRLFEITQNDIVILEIKELFSKICENFMVAKGQFSDDLSSNSNESSLKASFSMIEFICDYFIVTSDAWALNIAHDIAIFWHTKKGKTGLFPMTTNSKISFFDSQTDMTISLWRLADLTRSNFLKKSADDSFYALSKFHANQKFALNIDIDKGKVFCSTVRTKFVFLYLKALIAKRQSELDLSALNSDPKFRRLLRDR